MIESPQRTVSPGGGSSRGPGWWAGGPPATSETSAGGIDERLRRALWLAVCCLALAMLAFVTRPGNIIADTKIDMAIDPVSFLRRALQLWDPAQFGQLQNQAVGYFFPMGPFFVAGKLLALPSWVVQRLWLAALFIAAFLGAVRLSSRLGIGTPASRLAAGFGYALAPRALSLMGINSGEFLPAAMLPLILIPLVRLLRHGQEMDRRQKLRAAAQSAVAVALCSGMNAASVVAMLTLALIYLLTGQRSWSRWRVLAWWAPAVVLATWWWTTPLLLLAKYGVSVLPYSESAAITTSVTSLSNTLRGTEDWTTYLAVNGMPWWPVGFRISTTALPTILTGVTAALGLGGLLSRRLPERRFLLTALLIGIVIIGSGYVSGLGNPLAGLVDHVINGPLAPLRNIRKFDPLVRLPLALGLAQLLGSFRLPRVRKAAALVAACGIAGLAIPAAMTGLSADGDFPAVPSYWVSATAWLNAHARNQAVLAVPGASFGEYIWGRPMDDVLEAMFNGNWASTQLASIGSVGNTRLLDALEQRIEAGQGSAGLTQVLAEMGVKYIVVRNDLLRSDLYGAWPARVHDALYSSPGLVKVAQFGSYPVGSSAQDDAVSNFDAPYPPVEIFAVRGAQPVADLIPAAGTIRVYGGPESELNLADSGVLRDRPVLLNADSPGIRASADVITDSLRRIVRNFGEIRIDYSQTLTARDPATTFEAADDYLDPSWRPYLTVARYHGIANVTASSSGSGISALPGQSATGLNPFSAVDGNSRTMWESASVTGPVHQWLQVDFDGPVDAGVIHVAFADNPSVGPPVTKVAVQTSTGTITQAVRQTAAAQALRVPAGGSRWLRITIEAVAPTGYPLAGTQSGIAEISVPGVTASRSINAPDVAVPGGAEPSELLAKAEPQPSGCMLTSLRWVCSPSLVKPTEEQYGFDQGFTASRGHPATLSGLAIMTNDQLIARYADAGTRQPHVTASSTYTSDPQDQPSSAFDGDLATAWISGANDTHPEIKIRWHGTRTVKSVTVVRPPAASVPLQVLITGSGGQLRGGVVGPSGRLSFPPLRTDSLTLAFTPSQLPVQISEIHIPGVRPLTAVGAAAGRGQGQVTFTCGHGPTITVNGKPVATRATGTAADLLQGRPVKFVACSAVTVRAGANSVVEPATDPRGFDVQSVLVDPPGLASLQGGSTVSPAPVTTVRWGDASRLVRVAASQRSYLVVRQNYNAGWQASFGGRVLQPVQLDGWEQAWLLPAGTRGLVTLTYLPNSTYRDALFGGLGTLVLVILAALVPLRRRRRPARQRASALAEPGPQSVQVRSVRFDSTQAGSAEVSSARAGRAPGTWHLIALGKGAAGLGLLAFLGLWVGGRPAAVLLPAATLGFWMVRRTPDAGGWHLPAGQWLAPALMIAAAISGAMADLLSGHGDGATVTTLLTNTGPEVACLVIVAAVAAALVPQSGSRRAAQEPAVPDPAVPDPAVPDPAVSGPDATGRAAGPAAPGRSS
ncbi:MAG TPA: alpha-(1-_3)-arabinofuranosyltransferase family protein [Streptosporangiaceae bacterium]|nr:alpha-(1->3)-arabinofuranosyltransferase family protein [Streptosporangiaceae bacterium]